MLFRAIPILRRFSSTSSIFRLPKVFIIAGATCTGKSDAALKLCLTINKQYNKACCEIVIADSVQVYKHLTVGCTKPTKQEQQLVPHHLVDCNELGANPSMSAGDFVDMAMAAIVDINSRGKIAVVVGGATMWLDWLIYGKPNSPKLNLNNE